MIVIVGLGNPGDKYDHTRHNAGWDVVEVLAQRYSIRLDKNRFKAKAGEGVIGGKRVALIKPQTYMNASGESVVEAINWYKPDSSELVVIYDDVDIPAGSLRIRGGGSAGTHNGMRSIIYLLGKDNFPRVRVGIGKAPEGWELADYVLSHYKSSQERKDAYECYLRAADAVELYIKEGLEASMRSYNK